MNQFRLDLDATRCAQYHQDAHVGKMLLEAVQLLCTAFPVPSFWPSPPFNYVTWLGSTPAQRVTADLLPYAHTHVNHPCAVWTRATRSNFDSTIELAQALAAAVRSILMGMVMHHHDISPTRKVPRSIGFPCLRGCAQHSILVAGTLTD